jgi:hypothetical protein
MRLHWMDMLRSSRVLRPVRGLAKSTARTAGISPALNRAGTDEGGKRLWQGGEGEGRRSCSMNSLSKSISALGQAGARHGYLRSGRCGSSGGGGGGDGDVLCDAQLQSRER